MKRFSFPLERVLRWREEQATLEELKLEQLRARVAALEQQKRETAFERVRSATEVLSHRVVEATELQSLDSYRLHVRDKIRDLENRVRKAQAEAEQQRKRVVEAHRQSELLDRLKRRALAEWQAASDREEETLASELYLANHTRRTGRGR